METNKSVAKSCVPKKEAAVSSETSASCAENTRENFEHSRKFQDPFLAALAELGTVSHAAAAAGCSHQAHYKWLQNDPTYPARFAEAKKQALDSLIRAARRRAIDGVDEPVGFYKGQAACTVKRYSDILLMFLVKAQAPEYRDSYRVRLGTWDAEDPQGDADAGEKLLASLITPPLLGDSREIDPPGCPERATDDDT